MLQRIFKKLYKRLRVEYFSLLLSVYRLFTNTITIQAKEGRMTLNSYDQIISEHMLVTRQWSYDEDIKKLQFLKKQGFIADSHNIRLFDIGANIGMVGIGLLRSGEVSNVVAIEPEITNFKLLEKNVQQNNLNDKVVLINTALCSHNDVCGVGGKTILEKSNDNFGDHRIRRKDESMNTQQLFNESTRKTVEVQSMTLDQMVKLDEVKAIKCLDSVLYLDIQGYEGHVFEDYKGFLSSGTPAISEVWPYGILQSGMSLQTFASNVRAIWDDYWVLRRGKFVCYPTDVFENYLNELGNDGYFEDVIFTKRKVKH